MGIFSRLQVARRPKNTPEITWQVQPGTEDLEVVGEANYQAELWSLCGGSLGDRIRHAVVAVLIPEPGNPYDSNAISVRIEGRLIGYLSRQIAAQYIPGLHRLMSRTGCHVALHGVIVGGGYYDDGPGRLGVWLSHNPADFGIAVHRPASATANGSMRTGLSEAVRTDLEDESYDLAWLATLPTADRPAVAMLRTLLQQERSPIARHFQFAELEARLYHARDLYDGALDDFDEACRQHDAEMDAFRAAFIGKWGKVPLLETYRQMVIRQQKKQDWKACLWWAERGLMLYGRDAAREDAVEDLLKRRNRALAKLDEGDTVHRARIQPPRESERRLPRPEEKSETLMCAECHTPFDRPVTRGRKPRLCPQCR